jgi:hypothetical protein
MRRLYTGLLLLVPTAASACPFCAGGPSADNEVKRAIFGSGFGMNLLATGLPFAVVVGLAMIVRGPNPKQVADEGAVNGRAD